MKIFYFCIKRGLYTCLLRVFDLTFLPFENYLPAWTVSVSGTKVLALVFDSSAIMKGRTSASLPSPLLSMEVLALSLLSSSFLERLGSHTLMGAVGLVKMRTYLEIPIASLLSFLLSFNFEILSSWWLPFLVIKLAIGFSLLLYFNCKCRGTKGLLGLFIGI